MRTRNVSVLVVGLAGVGVVYVWSGLHGANITATFKDLLAGRAPGMPNTDPALVTLGRTLPGPTVAGQAGSAASTVGASGVGAQAGTAAGVGPSSNRANGQMQAAGYGWTGPQWTALDALWTRESDWNNTAQNPHSTAYGIAQFLDQTWGAYGGSKTSDPTVQIRLGLAYIKARYGTPGAAWSHEIAQGWY